MQRFSSNKSDFLVRHRVCLGGAGIKAVMCKSCGLGLHASSDHDTCLKSTTLSLSVRPNAVSESQVKAEQRALFDVQVFTPLVEKCKRLNRAMRIGTNHGSLSARILSYYGDTPRGMVESAFEFANICRDVDYHNFLFSMKASNPLVMVQAYRLLAEEMYSNGWDYPLHLGVTEVSAYVLTKTELEYNLFSPGAFCSSC